MKEPALTVTLDEDANCVWVEATEERRKSLTIEAVKRDMLQADCEAACFSIAPSARIEQRA